MKRRGNKIYRISTLVPVAPCIVLLLCGWRNVVKSFDWNVHRIHCTRRNRVVGSHHYCPPVAWRRKGSSPFDASSSSSSSSSKSPFFPQERPTPVMPSALFRDLAESQLELLAGALKSQEQPTKTASTTTANASKVKSMALYLPQENSASGQLEFIPAVLYPPPSRDRVFIASGAESGLAPTIPRTLTTLPGFSQARSLLPGYPMVQSGDEPGVGTVEEVLCAVDEDKAGAALSVPLFAGSQTTGVLLVYPTVTTRRNQKSVWTGDDRDQVARAAKTLSLALSMDAERAAIEQRQRVFMEALSDNLHQVKNPLQALRTYGKLLQQRIADIDGDVIGGGGGTRQLLELADHLMIQGDRLTARLQPVDAIIDEYTGSSRPLALMPATTANASSTPQARWTTPLLPFQNDATMTTTNAITVANESKSPLGDFECEMTFVADVLASTFDSFRAIALDLNVKFEVDEAGDLPGVTANADALQEAVSNVIDNSIKYVKLPNAGSTKGRNPDPKVRVRLFPNQDPDRSGVTIVVEDNGPGIPRGKETSIFQRGYRDESTQSVAGSGIGLSIAKDLTQRMGGTLEVAETNGKSGDALDGARFKFQLFRRP